MAAQLETDAELQVHRRKGRFGELRVVVDGTDVADFTLRWYPTPASLVERVRAHLRGAGPAAS